jgi:hypothetical protein
MRMILIRFVEIISSKRSLTRKSFIYKKNNL